MQAVNHEGREGVVPENYIERYEGDAWSNHHEANQQTGEENNDNQPMVEEHQAPVSQEQPIAGPETEPAPPPPKTPPPAVTPLVPGTCLNCSPISGVCFLVYKNCEENVIC